MLMLDELDKAKTARARIASRISPRLIAHNLHLLDLRGSPAKNGAARPCNASRSQAVRPDNSDIQVRSNAGLRCVTTGAVESDRGLWTHVTANGQLRRRTQQHRRGDREGEGVGAGAGGARVGVRAGVRARARARVAARGEGAGGGWGEGEGVCEGEGEDRHHHHFLPALAAAFIAMVFRFASVIAGGRLRTESRVGDTTKFVLCSLSFFAFHASSRLLFSATEKLAAASSS